MIEQGDVYLADMNPGRRSKPGKVRPVLVVQASDLSEAGKQSITIVPLTSQLLPSNRLRVRLTPEQIPGLKQDSDVLIDEIHTLHRSLFIERLGHVSQDNMDTVLQGIMFVLGIPRV